MSKTDTYSALRARFDHIQNLMTQLEKELDQVTPSKDQSPTFLPQGTYATMRHCRDGMIRFYVYRDHNYIPVNLWEEPTWQEMLDRLQKSLNLS